MHRKHLEINVKLVHQDRRRQNVNPINRFWSKVAKAGPDECWLWTAYKISRGYGIFQIGSKSFLAHRVAFALTNPFDHEKQVLHKCDVKLCCNPGHLYAGTPNDNMRDAYTRGLKLPVRLRGEQNPSAKLNHAKVEMIRRLYAETGLSQWKIARMFGIAQTTVSKIMKRKRWARA